MDSISHGIIQSRYSLRIAASHLPLPFFFDAQSSILSSIFSINCLLHNMHLPSYCRVLFVYYNLTCRSCRFPFPTPKSADIKRDAYCMYWMQYFSTWYFIVCLCANIELLYFMHIHLFLMYHEIEPLYEFAHYCDFFYKVPKLYASQNMMCVFVSKWL